MKKLLFFCSLLTLLTACSGDRFDNNDCNNNQTSNSERRDLDRQITTRVKAALVNDNSLSSQARLISVETTNGIVTLRGNVNSSQESNYVERKVSAIKGVCKVNNQLVMNP